MRHEKRTHRKIVALSLIVVFCMYSFSFVMVPLYNTLCRSTGLNGKVSLLQVSKVQNNNAPDFARKIILQFVATNNANLPWRFYPEKNALEVYPGQNIQMHFFVKNNSHKTMTVQAIASITPWQAVVHVHKSQCFCFSQQTLKAGESLSMPVVLQIDKQLPQNIQTITLAYTLFEIKGKAE